MFYKPVISNNGAKFLVFTCASVILPGPHPSLPPTAISCSPTALTCRAQACQLIHSATLCYNCRGRVLLLIGEGCRKEKHLGSKSCKRMFQFDGKSFLLRQAIHPFRDVMLYIFLDVGTLQATVLDDPICTRISDSDRHACLSIQQS